MCLVQEILIKLIRSVGFPLSDVRAAQILLSVFADSYNCTIRARMHAVILIFIHGLPPLLIAVPLTRFFASFLFRVAAIFL